MPTIKPNSYLAGLQFREIEPCEKSLIAEIGRLRAKAWSCYVPSARWMSSWLDELDNNARHWIALANGEIVGAARLSVHKDISEVPEFESYSALFLESKPQGLIGSINRLVVDEVARKSGLPQYFDSVRLGAAEKAGCSWVIVSTSSGQRRIQQLIECGFGVIGSGTPYRHPPLCYMPPPIVLMCKLPKQI